MREQIKTKNTRRPSQKVASFHHACFSQQDVQGGLPTNKNGGKMRKLNRLFIMIFIIFLIYLCSPSSPCPESNWGSDYLCSECEKLTFTHDCGECKECGRGTSSGAFELCNSCACILKQCQACGRTLN